MRDDGRVLGLGAVALLAGVAAVTRRRRGGDEYGVGRHYTDCGAARPRYRAPRLTRQTCNTHGETC